MKSKQQTQQRSTNTYGYMNRPTTQADIELDEAINHAFNTPDPTISYSAANQHEALNNRFSDMFGTNYSPEVKDAIKYTEGQNINQATGQAYREDSQNRNLGKLGAKAAVADARAPQLVQTGGTFQGTTTTNPGVGGLIMGGLSAGAQLGSAAMT